MNAKLLAYLRLFRLPNVFTAMADIGMGLCVTLTGLAHLTSGAERLGLLLLFLAASSFIYTAGMVLNDVFDLKRDAVERPKRPLPSGAISLEWAQRLGFGFLLIGMAFAWLAGYLFHAPDIPWWRAGGMATALAAMVLLYDGGLKKTPLGPIAMGGCRLLNILFAMSAGAPRLAPDQLLLGFDASQWLIAGGIGIYIMGVTVFARTEATDSSRGQLLFGTLIMAAGILMLAFFPLVGAYQQELSPLPFHLGKPDSALWPLLLLILSITLFRRIATVIKDPKPKGVQLAVKQSILSLVLFDASVAMAVAGPIAGILIVALLAPMLLLGRWVYST